MKTTIPDTTIVVPTFNEAGNVGELTRRLQDACRGMSVEILFVDDSTDDTPAVVTAVAATAQVPVRLVHRSGPERTGGLAGAVAVGLAEARGSWVVVMDGDLQHPPEMVPVLRRAAEAEGAQVAVASRYVGDGDARGLCGAWRHAVSSGSTLLTRLLFPRRVGRRCTDPMTGFFCLRRSAVDLDRLRPRGFKILLEVLARHDLTVAEVPFTFGERHDGDSKASWRQGLHFLRQLLDLRFGRLWSFGLVGASGVVVNLVAMALLLSTGAHYLAAAVVATELSIVTNFLLQEGLVFADLREAGGTLRRACWSMVFNNAELLARAPVLVLLVEVGGVPEVGAQALTLLVAFLGRFAFVSRVVYRPVDPAPAGTVARLEAA